MASKRRGRRQKNQRSDLWLWPLSLLLATSGWGQAVWMWNNTLPEGFSPMWLLLWVGVGVAGLALAVFWLALRWCPVAWLAVGTWLAIPSVNKLASQYNPTPLTQDRWLHGASPLLLLLLLGIGFSGLVIGVSSYTIRSWSGPMPSIRSLRVGFLSGLFSVICGWLQINRAFTLVSVFPLVGALVLVETFIVTRESPRKPSTKRKR